jgi:hypothetical protein
MSSSDDAGHGMGPRMRGAVFAIAEALFATAAGPPPAERLAWVVDELDDMLARVGAKSRLLFRLSVFAVAMLAPVLSLRFVPLGRMPLEARTHALEQLERSQLGLALLAVKAMLCVIYYEHPDAAREIGFGGSCLLQGSR